MHDRRAGRGEGPTIRMPSASATGSSRRAPADAVGDPAAERAAGDPAARDATGATCPARRACTARPTPTRHLPAETGAAGGRRTATTRRTGDAGGRRRRPRGRAGDPARPATNRTEKTAQARSSRDDLSRSTCSATNPSRRPEPPTAATNGRPFGQTGTGPAAAGEQLDTPAGEHGRHHVARTSVAGDPVRTGAARLGRAGRLLRFPLGRGEGRLRRRAAAGRGPGGRAGRGAARRAGAAVRPPAPQHRARPRQRRASPPRTCGWRCAATAASSTGCCRSDRPVGPTRPGVLRYGALGAGVARRW